MTSLARQFAFISSPSGGNERRAGGRGLATRHPADGLYVRFNWWKAISELAK